MEHRRVFGWLDTDVFIGTEPRELMLNRFSVSEHEHVGMLDPKGDETREILVDHLHERLSASYETNNRETLGIWLCVLGAAIVELAKSPEYPVMHVPGTQDDRKKTMYLYMCSGTCGERILVEEGRPYLCFPNDTVGEDLRLAFRKLFGLRVISRGPTLSHRSNDDPMLYVMLNVPWADTVICPCGSGKRYGLCHGATPEEE